MNYQAIYNSLCLRGQTPRSLDYSERHHIIPRHVGGTDDQSNLTSLTYKEHRLAHVLLYRIHGRWQDKVAINAMSGLDPEPRRSAQVQAGLAQVAAGSGIHSQSREERVEFGRNLSEWNKANPDGMLRGLAKCHARDTQLRMARSKAAFHYIDPTGKVWESRVEAAEFFGVKPHSIENWGKRQHYGWSRVPV